MLRQTGRPGNADAGDGDSECFGERQKETYPTNPKRKRGSSLALRVSGTHGYIISCRSPLAGGDSFETIQKDYKITADDIRACISFLCAKASEREAVDCFAGLGSGMVFDPKVLEKMMPDLTKEQYEALLAIAEQGGPDVEAIRRFRSASMI